MNLKKFVLLVGCFAFFVCSSFKTVDESSEIIQQMLTKYYDDSAESGTIKRYELKVTNTGSCRYRKTYKNGKIELFVFNLSRFRAIDYYGTATRGNLYLSTQKDDVIVQTFNDRKGAVDSMATFMVIPFKNIDTEQLNALQENLKLVNSALLAAKK